MPFRRIRKHCACERRTEPGRPAGSDARVSSTGEYTCPMHPEVVQQGPGSCPICGMALEPRAALPEAEANPELAAMSVRFWVCLVLTAPIFLLAMADMLPGMRALVPARGRTW